MDKLRIDKWLWAARFYKTRSLASDEIARGRVMVNGLAVKASRELKPGDTVALRQGPSTRSVVVRSLSAQRGPAPVAQQLYEETPESLALRAHLADQRQLGVEPAEHRAHGRPTKRERRDIEKGSWGQRWSASID